MPDSTRATRILLVDDDPTIARLVADIIEDVGFGPMTLAATAREALEALGDIDIVLLDHQLPDAAGIDILDAIRARPNPPAVVVITAHGNESLAAEALRRGADDYLAKDPSLTDLLPQILERVRRNRELRKALGAAELDLVQAERLGAIGEMTVALHHGINNPLMSATADVELLIANTGLSDGERREALRGIRDSLRRIRDIVRQIGDLRQVHTKAYLPGIRMVDLDSAGSTVPKESRGLALLLVPEQDLARVLALLLRDAGFVVERCQTAVELAQSALAPHISLIVLAGGTGAAGAHPLAGFSPPAERHYRVVALVEGNPGPAQSAGADLVIQLPFDTRSLTAEMIRLLH